MSSTQSRTNDRRRPASPVNHWIVHHACAGSEAGWPGPDEDRPLDLGGYQQADAVRRLLANEHPTALIASPTVRCRATLEPLGVATGLAVHDNAVLAAPTTSYAVLELMAALPPGAVLCTHGEVMHPLLELLRTIGLRIDGNSTDEQLLGDGAVWCLDPIANVLRLSAPLSER